MALPSVRLAALLCLLTALAPGAAMQQASRPQPQPPATLSDAEFKAFVDAAAECADSPVPSLLFRSTGGTETRLGSLNVEAKWLSAAPRSVDDVTVCTNSNFERLHMLEAQCESWGGPVSAVIYQPLEFFNQNNSFIVEDAKQRLGDLHARIDASGACQLDMVLVTEVLRLEKFWAYPYNSVRNQAVARTRTKLLVLLDVDFLLRKGLREHLRRPGNWEALIHDTYVNRDVVVLPAFETKPGAPLEEGREIAMRAFEADKGEVQRMFKAGEIVQFAPFYERGHGATNYKQWFKADRPYPVNFEAGFEPFVLMSRVHVPWYDERYRGYGWDKITQIYQMDRMGYNLVVHPHGFVVHRPHLPSAGYNQTFTGPAYTKHHRPTQFKKKMDKVAREMMSEIRAGTYPAYGVTALAGCRPLELFTSAAGSEGAERRRPRQWEVEGGEGELVASTEQHEARRVQDPVQGWW